MGKGEFFQSVTDSLNPKTRQGQITSLAWLFAFCTVGLQTSAFE